jgi:hypothetical protein
MRSLNPFASIMLIAAIAVPVSAPARAQEFAIEDISSPAAMAVDQLKPKVIKFRDRPGDDLIDPDAGLVRFEDWAQARPAEKQLLTPFPSYVEPYTEVMVDGVRKRFKEKLHMYVGQARFALARAPDSIKHRLITSTEAVDPKNPRATHNQHPLRRWCEVRPVTICIRSRYQFEGKLPIGIQIANKLRDAPKQIADYIEFESELTLRPPAEVTELGLASVSGIDTAPVGALEQNIFYVNQVMQFGKLLAVFQRHPVDPKQTVVTVFMSLAVESSLLGKKKEFMNVPVLRNLVPAQVIAGKSSFNTGNSISAGLPAYARNQIKAIATQLERK